jgi:hypothetical protein
VPEPNAFEIEVGIVKPIRHKSPSPDQIPVKLIKAGGGRIRSDIHNIIYSISNKKELHEEWRKTIIVPLYKKGDKEIVLIIEAYRFCQLGTKFYPASCCLG